MRIAYVVHQYPPDHIGGTEVYTATLARRLAEWGYEVHVFYPLRSAKAEPARINQEGVHLWRVLLPTRPQRAWAQFWQSIYNKRVEGAFRAFLEAVRPEVIHFQHLQNVSVRLPTLARPIPQVLTLHDYWYICPNGQLTRPNAALCHTPRASECALCALARLHQSPPKVLAPLIAPLLGWRNAYVRRAVAHIPLFLTPSEFARQVYIQNGWPHERLRVFPLGLDPARLASHSLPPPSRPPSRLHIGYLGAIAWQKGVHTLVEAFASLPQDASLTIYGDLNAFPDYAATLREKARRHPGIRFAGPAPYEAVGDILRQFDYLVVPSLWHETFGMVVQEAEAVGTPVIASRIGALQRIQEGVTGRLFEPGDVTGLARILQELYNQPEQRAHYQAHLTPGPLLADQARNLLEIYQALCKGAPPR